MTEALTPWNELRAALAELKDAKAYLLVKGGAALSELAIDRAMRGIERAAGALAPEDANND